MKITKVGLDLGNSKTQLVIDHDGKIVRASIPSRYAFARPPGEISAKTGQELRAKAFSLTIDGRELWFGQDVLGGSTIQEIDMAKYDANHIAILFRAVLYQACKAAKINIADLGRLDIVASMPPGLFQDSGKNKVASAAFRKAFNRGQSHMWIRSGKTAAQVVTKFVALQQEAVSYGQSKRRPVGPYSLIVDLGGGTNDYALFNGADNPLKTWTDNTGLLHVYKRINRDDADQVELKILRDKTSLPPELLAFFNEVKRTIQLITLKLPGSEIAELNIIGGGASLMTAKVKATFGPLAAKVFIHNEYANAEASLKTAVK